MSSSGSRALMLAGIGVALFGISTAVLIRVLPGPHTEKDYFIIGCMATLISLIAVFLLVITTWIKTPNLFVKRRKRPDSKMFDI
jgi:Na+/melibiose symporter-like transporter